MATEGYGARTLFESAFDSPGRGVGCRSCGGALFARTLIVQNPYEPTGMGPSSLQKELLMIFIRDLFQSTSIRVDGTRRNSKTGIGSEQGRYANALSGPPSARRIRPRDLEHDQPVGELVGVGAPRRKVGGEQLAAGSDRGDEASPRAAALELLHQTGDDLVPAPRAYLLVDTLIRHHLGDALGERDVDQDAGAALGGVDVLGEELGERAAAHPGMLDGFGHQTDAERPPQGSRRQQREDAELGGVDGARRPVDGGFRSQRRQLKPARMTWMSMSASPFRVALAVPSLPVDDKSAISDRLANSTY